MAKRGYRIRTKPTNAVLLPIIRRWGVPTVRSNGKLPAQSAALGFDGIRRGHCVRWLVLWATVMVVALAGWGPFAAAARAAGSATSISLQLSSATVTADGISSVSATVTAVDSTNTPVAGEMITLSSSDSGEVITPTPMTDNGDGTYSATIQASTTAGLVTITATDAGLTPVTASLTQTPGPPAFVSVSAPASVSVNSSATVTVLVTDQFGNPRSNDPVTFSPSAQFGPVTSNPNGTYSARYASTTAAGQVTITAADGSKFGQAIITQTPGSVASVSVQVSPSSIPANGSSTSTVTATVTDQFGNPRPNDTVKFSPSARFGRVTRNGNGTYSATYTSTTTAGQVTITATDGSKFGSTTLNQAAFASTTTLSSAPASPVTNQAVTLIATVTGSIGGPIPTGTVSFQNGGAPIAGCANQPVRPPSGQQLGQSTCQTSFSAQTGPERLSAVFTSNSAVVANSTGADAVSVGLSGTSMSLDVSNPSVNVKSNATFVAHIAPANFGPVAPSGTITFLDAGQPVGGCPDQPLTASNGLWTATCTVAYGQPGTHAITARYSGDSNFSGSASAPATVSVHGLRRKVLGTLTPTMQWTFFFTPRYTTIRVFVINGVPRGATVSMTCRGRGCPVKARNSRRRARRPTSMNLQSAFRHRHLKVGTRIVVKVTRPHWVGKYYRFTIRRAHAPAILIKCLAPGARVPGVGC